MKSIMQFPFSYNSLLSNKSFHLGLKAIFLLNTLSVLLTYLFDFAACQLCYLKLVIIFCTNTLFWFITFPVLVEKTSQFLTQWRKIIIWGMIAVCLNQLSVIIAWISIIGTFYECLALDFIPPMVLQNNFLFSVLSFVLIVVCVHFVNSGKKEHISRQADKPQEIALDTVSYLKNVSIKNGTVTTLIPVEKIYCIEADDNTIEFRTHMGKFVSYQSLKSIETQLDPAVFGRIYRSTVVNKNYIKKIQSLSSGDAIVFLDNGESLKMSRHYKTHFVSRANA
jgi:two-component system LytT family response regulator